jgi:RNA polymerase sigma factor (sigma-70 family)
MASVDLTHPAPGDIRFSADFVANISRYQLAIRRQPVMGWARERNLDGDLAQLALLDLARVDARFDPTRATSPHHFRLAVLGSRVSDCARMLMRMHREIAEDVHLSLDAEDEEGDEGFGARFQRSEHADDNPVLDEAIRGQVASAVYASVKTLPARQREVIELLLEDFTDKEIAAQLCVTVQAVNKTKLAAIAKLKQVVLTQLTSN